MRALVVTFILLCSFSTLFAQEVDQNQSTIAVEQNLITMQYEQYPQRVIKGEVFSITYKVINALGANGSLSFSFDHQKEFKLLTKTPKVQKEEEFELDTFYFQAISTSKTLPNTTLKLLQSGKVLQTFTLDGAEIETIVLSKRDDYCNIVAKDFIVKKSKTTTYDDTHNIVVFSAEAKQSNLDDFHLKNVFKQGFESKYDSIEKSKMIYYAIIDKELEVLAFSYFNLDKNRYITIKIPVKIKEQITAQSDLKPKDQSKKFLKISIALGILVAGIGFIVWKRRYGFIVLLLIPAGYIWYLYMEVEQVCIKQGTKVTILPLPKSTVFEVVTQDTYLDQLGTTKGYLKIELEDNKIGWVSEESTCSH